MTHGLAGNDLDADATVLRGEFALHVAVAAGAGQVVALLGPNGAGKTTLLRAVAGLTPITAGHVTVTGIPMDRPATGTFVPPEHRRVGLVFQNYRLFPHLDVRDNVAFAARAAGAGRSRSRQLTRSWLDQLDLQELAARRPAEISGGQAQRVAIARALAAEPALLLLDEPLAALDAQSRAELRSRLRGYLSGFGGPVVIVTHDPLDAMVLADRIVVLEDGRVVQDGTPAVVARRPATQYVARLMGLNLYRGRLGVEGQVDLDGGGTLVVPADRAVAVGGRVLVGLRPSSIAMYAARPDQVSARNVWSGTVRGFELLADRVRVEVRGDPDALVDITPAALADLGLRPGSEVWLSAKATETEAYPEPPTGQVAGPTTRSR
jgi:molybdate transport system ATP-binding protein